MKKISSVLFSSIFLVLLAAIIFVSPFSIKNAEAHISKAIGNYVIEIGWSNEPVYSGLLNAAQITIKKGSGDSAKPIINALKNLEVSVKYGGVTKSLDFLPSQTVEGQYDAAFIPTRAGTYSLVIKGSVEDQAINTEISLDDVNDAAVLNFPPTAGTTDNTANLNQMGTLVNQLTSDIEEAKSNAETASKSVANVGSSFQQVKDTTDKLYMISMTGIGIGIAGIIIAVVAINKNKKLD